MGTAKLEIQATPEFVKPGINPFIEVLSATLSRPKEETPIQKFRNQFRKLEKCAQVGDIPRWQKLCGELKSLAQAVNISLESDLESKVRLKQIELTLLFKAGNRALVEAEINEKKAAEAQIADKLAQAKEFLNKAQRLTRLGRQLHDQLLVKTA